MNVNKSEDYENAIKDSDFNEEIIKNDPFTLEYLEAFYYEILADENYLCKFYNDRNFNIFIFELESHGNDQVKKMVLSILSLYLKFFKISSRVLMFNILECLIKNIKMNKEESKCMINAIMDHLIEKYDLFIMAGHHNDIAKYVGLKTCNLCKSDVCDSGKIHELLKKYSNILWKHDKKSAKFLLKIISDKLFVGEKQLEYCEILKLLLNVDDIKLNAENEWCKNVSSFICNALRDKSIQKSDIPLNNILGLVNSMLKNLGLSWVPSTNTICRYHSETFLKAFSIIIGTFSSSMIASLEDNRVDRSLIYCYAESLEILLSFLSGINSDEDQEFSVEEEMLVVFILSKVSQYQTFITSLIDKMTIEGKFDDLFFVYLRSFWISNAILGKEVRLFLDSLKNTFKILSNRFAAIFNDSNNRDIMCGMMTADDRTISAGVCIDLVNIFEDVLRAEHNGDILPLIESVLMNLIDCFYKVLVIYVNDTEVDEVFVLGLVNSFNLFAYAVSLVENVEFLAKIDQLVSILMSEHRNIRNENCKSAMVNLLLQFYGHPMMDGSFNASELLNLFVWASRQIEDSAEMKENLSQGLDAFFEKYESLKTIYEKKLLEN